MPKLTKDQQEAVDREGSNIIVSAGAGSGKTAVLTQRVIRKLKDGISIDKLLILTFTNEAAGEMKDRIRNAIKKDDSLKDQLNYIDNAYITTFDSFALSTVKKYHYLLNLSKDISIVDSSIMNIKRSEFLDEVFEDLYEEENESFLKLISDFCVKNDTEIKKQILKINSSIDLKYDKKKFLESYIDDFYNDSYVCKIVSDFNDYVLSLKDEIKNLYEIILTLEDSKTIEKYEVLSGLVNSVDYDQVKKNLNVELPRIVKNSKKEKTRIKEILELLREITVYETLDDAKELYLSSLSYVSAIVMIIEKLDQKVNLYKINNNSFEYVDISKMAIDIVSKFDGVRSEIRDYYNEIMVDEYQDTNDLQEMFITAIEDNNVYMVGDIKQSIYRFRNANPLIFKNKYDLYSENNGGYKIDLLKNFRSREEVLQGINIIFNKIMDDFIGGADYVSSHQMVFGLSLYDEFKMKDRHNFLEIYNYDSKELKEYSKTEKEIFIVARDIKEKIDNHYMVYDKDTNKFREARYSDFCIIMDRGKEFSLYKKIFEYLNIPLVIYQDEKLTTSYDVFIIKNLINLIIKIKENKFDQEFKYYFMSVSRSFLFAKDDKEIFEIFKNNSFKDSDIYAMARDISLKLDEVSCYEFLEMILDKFEFFDKFISYRDIEQSMIRILYLEKLAHSLQSLGYTPYDFASYLKEMIDSDDEIKYKTNTGVSDSVKIMNIHKSKGLEFPVCYYTGLAERFNIRDITDKFLYDDCYGIITPYNKEGIGNLFTKYLVKNNYLKDEVSEKIRLFYVAVTRAREKMIFVAPLDNDIYNDEKLVDASLRLKYRSFLDIVNTIKDEFDTYIKNIDLESIYLSKDYNLYKKKDLSFFNDDKRIINKHDLCIDKSVCLERHFSKESYKLNTKEEISNMKFGTDIHYLFEVTDFSKESDNKYINRFLNQDLLKNIKNAKIYKEYEFMYEEDNSNYHGIIDLMLCYDDHIDIIDYKLSDVTDTNYVKQLEGYKNYISNRTGKVVYTYLYSILDDRVVSI